MIPETVNHQNVLELMRSGFRLQASSKTDIQPAFWMGYCAKKQHTIYTHVVINVRIVAVIEQRSLVDLLGLLCTVQFKQNVSSVDVGLSVVSTHADSLSV